MTERTRETVDVCKMYIPMRLSRSSFEVALFAAHAATSGHLFAGFITTEGDEVTSFTRIRDLSTGDATQSTADCGRGMAVLAAKLTVPLHSLCMRPDATRVVLDCTPPDGWTHEGIVDHFDDAFSVTRGLYFALDTADGGVVYEPRQAAVVVGPLAVAQDIHKTALDYALPLPTIEDFSTGTAYTL